MCASEAVRVFARSHVLRGFADRSCVCGQAPCVRTSCVCVRLSSEQTCQHLVLVSVRAELNSGITNPSLMQRHLVMKNVKIKP